MWLLLSQRMQQLLSEGYRRQASETQRMTFWMLFRMLCVHAVSSDHLHKEDLRLMQEDRAEGLFKRWPVS